MMIWADRILAVIADKALSAGEIAKEIGATDRQVRGSLETLRRRGLAESKPGPDLQVWKATGAVRVVKPHKGAWTPEEIETARVMFVERGISGLKIALQLGKSRSAVIGKMNRTFGVLGVEEHRLRAGRAGQAKPQRKRQRGLNTFNGGSNAARKAPTKPPALFIVPEDARTLRDLGHRMCHWPVGDLQPGQGADLLFCSAAVAEDGCPYCPGHKWLAADHSATAKARRRDRRMAA